jgi:hypothetical protein
MRTWLASIALSAPLSSCCTHDEIWESRSTNIPYGTTDQDLAMKIGQCLDTADCEPLCLYDWMDWGFNNFADADYQVRNCKLTMS